MSISKIQARIEALTAKQERKQIETVRLAVAVSKIEDKSASKLWRKIQESEYSAEIYGLPNLPTFADWLAELTSKPTKNGLFSEHLAFLALARMGKKLVGDTAADLALKALKKAKKQQAATDAK